MSKIIRENPSKILSRTVEYHGFVYMAGTVANDLSKDIKGQTKEILAQIDEALEKHGTDKTRLLQAIIWVKDITQRADMNEVWSAWLPQEHLPVRACTQAALADPRMLVEIMVTACK